MVAPAVAHDSDTVLPEETAPAAGENVGVAAWPLIVNAALDTELSVMPDLTANAFSVPVAAIETGPE